MSVTLSNLETKVRYLVGDTSTLYSDVFTYNNSNVFTLTESNGVTITTVYKNNVEMGDSESSYDSTSGKITINLTMSSGDVIEIIFSAYPNYSSTEIQNYIQASLVHISANNLKTWVVRSSIIYPEPNVNEENLICMITALLIEPGNVSYRLPDISINLPKDLPTHEKIRRTITIFKHSSHGIFSTT